MSVKKQEQKNATLRNQLVQFVKRWYDGRPILGGRIVDAVKVELALAGVMTTGEVLGKELRKAARKGELARGHVMINRRRFVQYSPAGCHAGATPVSSDISPDTSSGGCSDGGEE
jgi:hypothetical protein